MTRFSALPLIMAMVWQSQAGQVAAKKTPAPVDPAPTPASPVTPTISLPPTLKVAVGKMIRLKAVTNGKIVNWKMIDAGLDQESDLKDPTCFHATGPTGTYRIIAATAIGDAVAVSDFCIITIGNPAPPGPGPPAPAVDLATAIQDAYTADTGTDKASKIALLASIYAQSGPIAVDDPTAKTFVDVLATVKAAIGSLMPATTLQGVRKAIAADVQAAIPPAQAAAPLTPDLRAKIKAEYAAIATALKGVKP